MKRGMICGLVCVLSVSMVCVATGQPGFAWGLAFCGPASGTTSLAACNLCCQRAGASGAIPPQNVAGCLAACAASTFPPPPTFWQRVLIWAFS